MLPLYTGAQHPDKLPEGHKGLWFERFFNGYNFQWSVEENKKQQWIDAVTGNCGLHNALHQHALTQAMLCSDLGGTYHVAKNTWNTVIGMGNNHPVENGFSWHPTLGTPYLTGAAVKGLLRSWLEEWSGLEDTDLRQKCHRWFGSESKDPAQQINDNQTGSLIFFDALPVASVALESDIMTPHMGDWYQKGGEINANNRNKTLPADWHNPIPVPFLVMKKASLLFCIAPRSPAIPQEELSEAMQTLQMALEYLGAGAKTAAGYGRFEADTDAQKKLTTHLKKVKNADLPPEEALYALLSDKETSEKTIAEMFGKNIKQTKADCHAQNGNWEAMIAILMQEKSKTIRGWKTATKKSATGKAYKNLNAFLPPIPAGVVVIGQNEQVSNYNLTEKMHPTTSIAMDWEVYKTLNLEHLVLLGTQGSHWSELLMFFIETQEEALEALMDAEADGTIKQALLDPFKQPLSTLLSIPCEILVIDNKQHAQETLQQKLPQQDKAVQQTICEHFVEK